MTVQSELSLPVSDEDRLRAETYILLALLLATPPTSEVLDIVADLQGGDNVFGNAINALAVAAQGVNAGDLDREYTELFVGVPMGALVPHASYYLTGALFSKPLARLRMDMSRLGIARARTVNEPEDHIAGLCEMMAGLILGAFSDQPASLSEQKDFFETHLQSWAPRFFEDLESTEAADFYTAVGNLGCHFLKIERQAFDLID